MKRDLFAALVVSHLWAAGIAAQTVKSPSAVGCYAIAFGDWTPVNRGVWAIPPSTMRLWQPSGIPPFGMVTFPGFIGASPSLRFVDPTWTQSGKDSLLISFHYGRGSVHFGLVAKGDSLVGQITSFSDSISSVMPHATVRAVRSKCPV